MPIFEVKVKVKVISPSRCLFVYFNSIITTDKYCTTGEWSGWCPVQRRPIRDAADDVITKSHLLSVWRNSIGHVTRVDGTKRRSGDFRVTSRVDDQRPVCRQVDTLAVEYHWAVPTWPGHVHTGARVADHVTREPSDGWRVKGRVCCMTCDTSSICNQSVFLPIVIDVKTLKGEWKTLKT